MINKDCFVGFIKQIERFKEEQIKATNMLIDAFDVTMENPICFGSYLVDSFIDLLSMSFDSNDNIAEMESIEDWIIWYFEERQNFPKQICGKKNNGIFNVTIKNKKYFVDSPESLYDMLIDFIVLYRKDDLLNNSF